jgi:hypothetical protein
MHFDATYQGRRRKRAERNTPKTESAKRVFVLYRPFQLVDATPQRLRRQTKTEHFPPNTFLVRFCEGYFPTTQVCNDFFELEHDWNFLELKINDLWFWLNKNKGIYRGKYSGFYDAWFRNYWFSGGIISTLSLELV